MHIGMHESWMNERVHCIDKYMQLYIQSNYAHLLIYMVVLQIYVAEFLVEIIYNIYIYICVCTLVSEILQRGPKMDQRTYLEHLHPPPPETCLPVF